MWIGEEPRTRLPSFALKYRAAVQFLIFFASSPSKPVHFASRSPRLE
jgi:hypothetical protein